MMFTEFGQCRVGDEAAVEKKDEEVEEEGWEEEVEEPEEPEDLSIVKTHEGTSNEKKRNQTYRTVGCASPFVFPSCEIPDTDQKGEIVAIANHV